MATRMIAATLTLESPHPGKSKYIATRRNLGLEPKRRTRHTVWIEEEFVALMREGTMSSTINAALEMYYNLLDKL